MEQYQIVPWDDLSSDESMRSFNLEQYVPPEVEKLAYEVMKSYDMSVSGMTLITSKPDKGGAIWRIETNRGPRSLKVLHRTPQRSLFSVGAQEYVVSKGARVPGIILTKDGRNSVEAGGKLWIVTDWIDTLTPVMKIDLEGARTLCHGLGEFHQWSKGYEPPAEAGKSSRIFKWESQYQKIMTKIGWFRHIANAYPNTEASGHLLSVLDTFEGQARDILKRFQESAYKRMVAKGEAHWGLAHQDYGWSNGQMGPGGIWVIDLDGVAFDLPIRDLRKIITSTMDDMGAWDLEWIRGVIDAYHSANPLDQETFELLWIDMAFPNEFYKHVKEVVFTPVEFMNTELNAILDRVVATETNKWDVLRELEKDKTKYAAGDYPDVTAAPSGPYRYKDYAKEGAAPIVEIPGSKRKRKDKDKGDAIRIVLNPDGKAKIIPGGETPRKLSKKEEKKLAKKEEKKLSKKQLKKLSKKELKKLSKKEEKKSSKKELKKLSKKELRKLQRSEQLASQEGLAVRKPEKAVSPLRQPVKAVAPERERMKRYKYRTEPAAVKPKSGKPSAGSGQKSRSTAAGSKPLKRSTSTSKPGAALKEGLKKAAGGGRTRPAWNKGKKKVGVKLYLTAYRDSKSARRTGLEHFDDLHGEAAGTEY
ncbi:hypothetical protein B1748_12685 [Paenibacillus sp. MY03]|uniref:CotS family spore coat protein n=1 Tax=Paenibacillus sp. MY03 TaxID=302980 RepID=UPI000B574B2A|nr:CotS family spore coat protein [Paenibacillus sp. MY03]OUS76526.1 hypothetical protein B1748_12685 [Paenibacillus sp. MY03]